MLKEFSQLTLADTFIFDKVFSDTYVVLNFLRYVLRMPADKVEFVSKSRIVKDNFSSAVVRVNVHTDGHHPRDCIVEIQLCKQPIDAKRGRLYSSLLDSEYLREDGVGSELPEVFIIYICQFDPLPEYGLAQYTVEQSVVEVEEPYDNGLHTILFNTKYVTLNVDAEVGNFLRYIEDPTSKDAFRSVFVHLLHKAVERVKGDLDTEIAYLFSDKS